MAKATLKTIEQNDNVGMFSICFDGSEVREFEKVLNEFKDNATYNKDFNVILLALSKIIDKGALERFFRNEGRMNDNVKALAIDSRKLKNELGWEPSLQFEEGIEKTVRWYLENQEWMDHITSGEYEKYYESMYKNR